MRSLARRLYLCEIATFAAVAAVLVLYLNAGVRFDVLGSIGQTAGLVVPNLLAFYVLLAPLAAIIIWRTGRHLSPASDPRRRRVWMPFLRLLACFAVSACAYSFLGVLVPRYNGNEYGALALQLDAMIGLGTPPNQLLGSFSDPGTAEFMRVSYLSYLAIFPSVTALAFFRADVELLEDLFQGFVLVMLLGAAVYFVVPVHSTLYTHPEWHSALLDGPVGEWRLKLLAQHEAVRQGIEVTLLPFSELAAFPSLHVAEALIALVFVGNRYPAYLWAGIPHFVLILLSTVYTGQHFVVDWFGAVPLVWLVYKLVAWDRRRRAAAVERISSPASVPAG